MQVRDARRGHRGRLRVDYIRDPRAERQGRRCEASRPCRGGRGTSRGVACRRHWAMTGPAAMAPCARSIDVEDVVQIVRQQELDVAIRSMYAAAPQRSEEDALTLDRSTFRDNALAPTQSMSTDATWIIRRISMPRGVGQADGGTACGGLLSEDPAELAGMRLLKTLPHVQAPSRHRCTYKTSVLGASVCVYHVAGRCRPRSKTDTASTRLRSRY